MTRLEPKRAVKQGSKGIAIQTDYLVHRVGTLDKLSAHLLDCEYNGELQKTTCFWPFVWHLLPFALPRSHLRFIGVGGAHVGEVPLFKGAWPCVEKSSAPSVVRNANKIPSPSAASQIAHALVCPKRAQLEALARMAVSKFQSRSGAWIMSCKQSRSRIRPGNTPSHRNLLDKTC